MVGWHHRLDGLEFEQILGDNGRLRSLVSCNPCGHKEADTTEQLNNKMACELYFDKTIGEKNTKNTCKICILNVKY